MPACAVSTWSLEGLDVKVWTVPRLTYTRGRDVCWCALCNAFRSAPWMKKAGRRLGSTISIPGSGTWPFRPTAASWRRSRSPSVGGPWTRSLNGPHTRLKMAGASHQWIRSQDVAPIGCCADSSCRVLELLLSLCHLTLTRLSLQMTLASCMC